MLVGFILAENKRNGDKNLKLLPSLCCIINFYFVVARRAEAFFTPLPLEGKKLPPLQQKSYLLQ